MLNKYIIVFIEFNLNRCYLLELDPDREGDLFPPLLLGVVFLVVDLVMVGLGLVVKGGLVSVGFGIDGGRVVFAGLEEGFEIEGGLVVEGEFEGGFLVFGGSEGVYFFVLSLFSVCSIR